MTPDDPSTGALPAHVLAFALPFAVCFMLARRGHARKAWWLPGGILAMTAVFVGMGALLAADMQTGAAAAQSLAVLSVPAILGGAMGILLGRRRA